MLRPGGVRFHARRPGHKGCPGRENPRRRFPRNPGDPLRCSCPPLVRPGPRVHALRDLVPGCMGACHGTGMPALQDCRPHCMVALRAEQGSCDAAALQAMLTAMPAPHAALQGMAEPKTALQAMQCLQCRCNDSAMASCLAGPAVRPRHGINAGHRRMAPALPRYCNGNAGIAGLRDWVPEK